MNSVLPSPDTPLVHAVRAGNCAAAFVGMESPLPSPPTTFQPPPLQLDGHASVVGRPDSNHFCSALHIRVPAGGVARVRAARGEHHRAARVLVPLQGDCSAVRLGHGGSNVSVSRLSKTFPELCVHACVVHDLDNGEEGLESVVSNESDRELIAVVGDIFVANLHL